MVCRHLVAFVLSCRQFAALNLIGRESIAHAAVCHQIPIVIAACRRFSALASLVESFLVRGSVVSVSAHRGGGVVEVHASHMRSQSLATSVPVPWRVRSILLDTKLAIVFARFDDQGTGSLPKLGVIMAYTVLRQSGRGRPDPMRISLYHELCNPH